MDCLQGMNHIKAPQKQYPIPFKKAESLNLYFWSFKYHKNLCTLNWSEPAGEGVHNNGLLRWVSLCSSCIMSRALPVSCAVLHHASLSPVPWGWNPWGQGETACSGHVLEMWEHPGDIQPLSWEKCCSSTPFICYLDDSYCEKILSGMGICNFFHSLVLTRIYCKYMSIFIVTELSLLLYLWETHRISLILCLLVFTVSK